MSSYLCEDLIGEIFERLPAKTLFLFRCLSKSWYFRIGSPFFIRRHYLRSSQKVLIRRFEISSQYVPLKHYHGRDEVKDLYALLSEDQFPLSHAPGYHFDISTTEFPCNHPKVVNSCNGIFCLRDFKMGISLWNPSIRRKLVLPDQPRHYGQGSQVTLGLGLDPLTNDYKVVSISYLSYKRINVAISSVYSMNTRVWSPIASPTIAFGYLDSRACFVDGVLHWVATLILPDNSFEHCIMTFSLSTNVFGKIKLPKPSWLATKLTIIDGCLAVICYEGEDYCWIWVMKEYGNVASSYVLFKLKCKSGDAEIKRVMQLNINGYFLINNYRGGLEVYNPETGVRFDLFGKRFYKVNMETCVESLELLNSGELE